MWCIFPFPTKALNIHNSYTNTIPKVDVHLGIIGLHPLHFPSFVKVCFTPKHTLDLMGLCTSHLIANPMLGLQHIVSHLIHSLMQVLSNTMAGVMTMERGLHY
jgi:hypothetical protein